MCFLLIFFLILPYFTFLYSILPPSTPNSPESNQNTVSRSRPSALSHFGFSGGICQAVRHVSSLGREFAGPPQPHWMAGSPGRQAWVLGFSSRSAWVSAVLPSIMAHGWAAGHPSCLSESPGTESLGPCSLFV